MVETGILSRMSGIYTGFAPTPRNLTIIKQSLSRDESQGIIQYSKEATDNNQYIDASGIKKYEIDVTIAPPVHLVQNFNIFNQKEIIQTQRTNTQGQINISIRLRGKRTSSLQQYFSFAEPRLTVWENYGADGYLEDLSYTVDPQNTSFSMDAQYRYLGDYKTLQDTRIT